jgi:[ribosomal protein S5]-alanine N-acetyltransferase
MARQVVLETERMRLETWLRTPQDFEDLYQLHADVRMQPSYAPGPEKWTRDGLAKRFSEYLAEQDQHGLTKWRAVLNDSTFVGRAGWSPWHAESLEIGYAFKPDFWGLGLATEVASALIAWARLNRPEFRLVGFALTHNLASRHILARSGMSFLEMRDIGGVENAYYVLSE